MSRILIAGAIFAAGAVVGGGVAWTANGWRLGEVIADLKTEREAVKAAHARDELSAALKAGIRTAELTKQVEDARNDATKREQDLRRSAAGARAAADGLRDELAAIRRSLPELAVDACRVRADTLAELFGQCATRYSELGEKAGRHANDVQALSEAWPK